MQNIYKEVNTFLGIKNDEDIKEIQPEYFWQAKNFNFQSVGLSGMEKITMPKQVNYLATNPDGTNWGVQLLGTGNYQRGVGITWDGNRFLMTYLEAPNTYSIKYSYDGENWETKMLPYTTKAIGSIAYGNGIYIITGLDSSSNYSILRSTDGETWTEIEAPNSNDWHRVRFVKDRFIALAYVDTFSNNIMQSTDGITWTLITTSIADMAFSDVIYAKSKYIAVGRNSTSDGKIIYSYDLTTWTLALEDLTSIDFQGIAYGNGLVVVVGGNSTDGMLYTSDDGINWIDNRTRVRNADWYKICWTGTIFVACSRSTTTTFMYSSDTITWTDVILSSTDAYPCNDIIYADRLIISPAQKVLSPGGYALVCGRNDSAQVDGLFEYRYLDSDNVLQTEQIGVCNGKIYKDILSNPVILSEDISKGKCSFAVLNDSLYIANGKDYVWKYNGIRGVVTQMGAPTAGINGLGILNGNYYYAITNVLAGGEEYVGSISNTVSLTNNKVLLDIPIGYTGTISRKIYRTTADGTTLKLLATIADNTTLTYSDNIADSSLGAQIININNGLPKPYFLAVYNERLIGAKVDLYPTQIFISDVEIDFFDLGSNGLDIANYSDDNSPVSGLGIDFSNLMVATAKHWYLITIDGTGTISVQTTRVNIGCKDGYSVVRIPTYGNFSGGLMFVSNNNDVRVLNGLRAIPVSTSVDNISSDIFSQNVKGTMGQALNGASNISAAYYDYKYHLIIDGNKYVFDIRLNGWTFHEIQTENYKSEPIVLAIFNDILYNGQIDGWVEQEYFDVQYRREEVVATLESVQLSVSKDYNSFQKLVFWMTPTESNAMDLTIVADDDVYFADKTEFDFMGGAFDEKDFSETEYDTSGDTDFKTYNIHKPVRWLRWILNINEGNLILRKWGMYLQTMTGKE